MENINIPSHSSNKYQYSQYTPIQARLNYLGPLFINKDGAIFIHNNYIGKFDYCDVNAKVKVVLEVKKNYQNYEAMKDRFGLLKYKQL